MNMKKTILSGNLFSNARGRGDREVFEPVLVRGGIKIERIVSLGQATPAGKWLRQSRDEWVLVLRGAARLRIAGARIALKGGDHLFIPAGTRHRVEWTRPGRETLWLAVHTRARKSRKALKKREGHNA